jgi:archaellum biogenesis ATPase FlaH
MPVIQSNTLEIRILKTLASSNKRQLGKLVRVLNEKCFQSTMGQEIYKRIITLVKDRGVIIGWPDLCVDPALRESTRKAISKYKKPPIRNEARLDFAIKTLVDYRKARAIFDASEYALKAFERETLDVDELASTVQTMLNEANSKVSSDSDFIDIGSKDDRKARRLIRNILKDSSHRYIPTGLREFDNRNIGIPRGTFFTIQTNSGGGKSVMANQLCGNMAMKGARVCLVPLEMTGDENTRRHVSRVTDFEMGSIVNTKKLSKPDKEKITASWLRYNKRIRKAGGILSIFTPKEDMTAEEILFTLKPRNYDVIIIDYIGLLKGTDGEDQARKLGAAGRFMKRFADIHDMCVGVCAQLSDDNKVRYSRAINEHSGLSFSWQYDKAAKESKIIKVEFPKSRNLDPQPFYMTEEFKYMRFGEISDDEAEKIKNSSTSQQSTTDDTGKKGRFKDEKQRRHHEPKATRNSKEERQAKKVQEKNRQTVSEEDFVT